MSQIMFEFNICSHHYYSILYESEMSYGLIDVNKIMCKECVINVSAVMKPTSQWSVKRPRCFILIGCLFMLQEASPLSTRMAASRAASPMPAGRQRLPEIPTVRNMVPLNLVLLFQCCSVGEGKCTGFRSHVMGSTA